MESIDLAQDSTVDATLGSAEKGRSAAQGALDDLVAKGGGVVLDATFEKTDGPGGLEAACIRLAEEALTAALSGAPYLIVSDGAAGADRVALMLFGPDSVTWRVHGHPAMLIGGMRATLERDVQIGRC